MHTSHSLFRPFFAINLGRALNFKMPYPLSQLVVVFPPVSFRFGCKTHLCTLHTQIRMYVLIMHSQLLFHLAEDKYYKASDSSGILAAFVGVEVSAALSY